MLEAVGWGALAASSLLIGAWLGLVRRWPDRLVGHVLAFGAGALVSAVAFELAQEGVEIGGGPAVAVGLGIGALVYFALDKAVSTMGAAAGPSLALGATLDGIPEQLVLGLGMTAGGMSVGLLAAVFVSNLPEAIGASSDLRADGWTPAFVWRLWLGVAAACTLATVAGFAIGDSASGWFKAGLNGFAAGAVLVMLADSMVPEARRKAGRTAGLATVLGFAVAAGISALSA